MRKEAIRVLPCLIFQVVVHREGLSYGLDLPSRAVVLRVVQILCVVLHVRRCTLRRVPTIYSGPRLYFSSNWTYNDGRLPARSAQATSTPGCRCPEANAVVTWPDTGGGIDCAQCALHNGVIPPGPTGAGFFHAHPVTTTGCQASVVPMSNAV